MNRLTALGLASLAAYALLIGSKYAGFVPGAREARATASVVAAKEIAGAEEHVGIAPAPAELAGTQRVALPPPVPRAQPPRATPTALDFRGSRDLRTFAESLLARRESLTAEERYYLAKALEECQFATTINEDLAAYSARQKRQFLAALPAGDPLNSKRIAAFEAADSSQRCLRFQGTKIALNEIAELYRAAAMQGDPRAQSRLVVAELNTKNIAPIASSQTLSTDSMQANDFSRLVSLLESYDPEAILQVGQYLAQSSVASQLRIGPNGETPEPSAFLGAFSLVACDVDAECASMGRELQLACAHAAYCNAQNFEELYQNFVASPWMYAQAQRYRSIIHNAIRSHDWALLGLRPKGSDKAAPSAYQQQSYFGMR